jgi:long-chain acyl-CoA synthetase
MEYADLPAIRCFGKEWSYRATDAMADRIAHGLVSEASIRPGDRVGLFCINSPYFVASYFGISRAGGIVVPINLLLHPEEISFILDDAGVEVVLYHEAMETQMAEVRERLGLKLRKTFAAGGTKGGSDGLLDQMLSSVTAPFDEPQVNTGEDVAVIIYTSGTTGRPKGAMLTHGNLLANLESVVDAFPMGAGDRIITVLPMFHAFAATACMLSGLRSGAAVVAVPRFSPDELSGVIEKEQGTIFMGVPSMYSVLANLPADRSPDLSSLRFCVSGGAAMPVELMKRFEERYGVLIYEGDGPTECSPVTSVNPIDGVRKPGSIGLPVANVEMRIVDDAGEEVPNGEVGEIVVRGPNVMKGYWNLPEETAESFFGEWFRTGDLGHRDDDGYFFIVDRKKDMIIVNGMNVYPRQIEEIIYQYPGILECAVVGDPHPLHGEVPKAYYVLRPDAEVEESDLRRWCLQHLGRHQVPKRWQRIERLPRNATGKIVKRELARSGEVERGIDSDQNG